MLVKLGGSSIRMVGNNGNRGVPSSSITIIFLAQFLALSRLSVIFYSRLIDRYINSTQEIIEESSGICPSYMKFQPPQSTRLGCFVAR